ncbi:unnamed protein product [Dovyalis caffra]|uniref:Eukaryotic translation initiation factor isoform 4E n=1 Tax=Dovyalis caffra TaxID=77055 RepID=A0AAV1R1T4_9ROSI|nr:unnamed protein product [Dovyalis caffra]
MAANEAGIEGSVTATATEEVVTEKPQPHKLERKWTFWFDNQSKPKQGAAWGTSLRNVYSFDTVEEFWCLYEQIFKPSKLPGNADFHLFKAGIEPKWEDPVCATGGKWSVTSSRKSNLDTMWLETMMALIGEQFDEADEICGVVASVRQRQDKLALWTKTAANEAAQRFNSVCISSKGVRGFLPTVKLKFLLHSPVSLPSFCLVWLPLIQRPGKKHVVISQILHVNGDLVYLGGEFSVSPNASYLRVTAHLNYLEVLEPSPYSMSIGRKWKEIIDVTDKITYSFHVIFALWMIPKGKEMSKADTMYKIELVKVL